MLYSTDLNEHPNADLIEVLPNNARFRFRLGLNFEELEPLRARVDEAYARLVSIGFIPNLEKITRPIDFTSIYSTNAIEGGKADLELVKKIMAGNLEKPKNETERRIKNLIKAYHDVEKYYNSPRVTKLYPPILRSSLSNINPENFVFQFSERLFQDLNKIIMADLPIKTGKPGIYRNDQKQAPTVVGNADTGGVYKPPKKTEYIRQLMKAFIGWMNSEPMNQLSVLYRAPLTHFYYELIHPFADGNGRVGRLVELVLLGNVGYEHVGKLMAEYYYKNIKKYFTLFNACRKSKEKYPNTQFVKFFLEGMLFNINYLQDKANEEIARIYYWQFLQGLLRDKKINDRQFNLIEILLSQKKVIINVSQLKEYPAYKGLYHNLTKKTQSRDLKTLQELNLLEIDSNKNIQIKYIDPAIILAFHPFCAP